MQLGATIRKYGPVVGFIFLLYAVFALLSAVGAYVAQRGMEQRILWGPLLRQEFKDWFACAVVSIAVLWFCSRNRLEPGRAGRWVARHFGAAFLFSAAYSVLTSWLVAGERSVMHPERTLTFAYLIKNMGLHYCVLNMIMYWLVVFAHFSWHFYQRYREREVSAAQLQRELSEARLEALRMQLNPHFLFNTLHAVSALIHENPEAADRVVARLSELLRLTLDKSKPQEVPLREEMAFLERYLEIEQMRFTERLKVDIQIDPEAEGSLVPYLILQPLVENAIRHGIELREEQGRLTISARRNNGHLELRVRDNGPGLPKNGIQFLREGIGLSNTRSRLRHLYGERFQLELAGAQGGGLEARLDIPYHTQPEPTEAG
jgi:two-component system LytT family sensor kinase